MVAERTKIATATLHPLGGMLLSSRMLARKCWEQAVVGRFYESCL